MSRDNLPNNIGIAWNADPDPEVFEYLVYWKTTVGDDVLWLESIDAGTIPPSSIVAAPATQFLFGDGAPEVADYAVVSHARDADGLERWSSPYSPAEFQDIPLDPSAPELTGPTGGRVLSDV